MLKVTKIRFPNAAVLAIAAVLGLATAPAKAAIIVYTNCASTTYCTLQELVNGGTITVDEDSDGKIDKTFNSWQLVGSPTGFPSSLTPPSASNIKVSAFSSGPLNVGLDYEVLDDDFKINNNNIGTQFLGLEYSFKVIPSAELQLIDSTYSFQDPTTDVYTNSGGGLTTYASVVVNGNLTSLTDNSSVSDVISQTSLGNVPTQTISPTTLSLTSEAGFLVDNNIGVTTNSTSAFKASANLKKFRQEFRQTFAKTQVPEPGTIMGLLAFGGVCLVMKRK